MTPGFWKLLQGIALCLMNSHFKIKYQMKFHLIRKSGQLLIRRYKNCSERELLYLVNLNLGNLLYPRFVVYRGYIVFAFSVIMFVCLSVCLSVNFFFVKDFSATTWVRILKFGTRLDSD